MTVGKSELMLANGNYLNSSGDRKNAMGCYRRAAELGNSKALVQMYVLTAASSPSPRSSRPKSFQAILLRQACTLFKLLSGPAKPCPLQAAYLRKSLKN